MSDSVSFSSGEEQGEAPSGNEDGFDDAADIDAKPPALPENHGTTNDDDDEQANATSDAAGAHGLNNDTPATKEEPPQLPTATAPYGFELSTVRRKKSNGALICMALDCEKNAQGSTRISPDIGGLCRAHYNAYLISTDQIESWDCVCGNKIVMTSARCGKCHRWKEGTKAELKTGPPGGLNGEGKKKRKKKSQSSSDGTGKSPSPKRQKAASSPASTMVQSSSKSPPKKRDFSAVSLSHDTVNVMTQGATLFNHNPNGVLSYSRTYVPPSSGLTISNIRKTNDKGRPLCKIESCTKLDQTNCDGFCMRHFNMFSIEPVGRKSSGGGGGSNGMSGGDGTGEPLEDWTCSCGNIVKAKKKRCGGCNKWKGGKRDPYQSYSKKANANEKAFELINQGMQLLNDMGGATGAHTASTIGDAMATADQRENVGDQHWTCNCGNVIPQQKSRCGKCHHWRGGKRTGGWKIKDGISAQLVDDTGIDWNTDWMCCGLVIAAKKSRCGKCHGWRGGKRVAKSLRGVTGGTVGAQGVSFLSGVAVSTGHDQALIAALPTVPPAVPALDHTYNNDGNNNDEASVNNESEGGHGGEGHQEEDQTNITFI